MKRIALIILALLALALFAEPTFYPLTTLAENCLVHNNAACDYNNTSLNGVLDNTSRNLFLTSRLYHASGDLTNPSTDQRFLSYNVTTVPTVVFNGSMSVVGGGSVDSYMSLLDNFLFLPSPLKMQVTNFNSATGAASVAVTLLDPTVNITDQDLVWFLVEDNVDAATNVTRQVLTQSISLPVAGDPVTFTNTFTLHPAWNLNNLWMMACVQLDTSQILQSVSSLPNPTHSLRCSFDWEGDSLVGNVNASLTSETLWFFNMGAADDKTIQIVVDNAPADWGFNFCDEIGNCYPGSSPLPLSMAAGEVKGFHLNLWIGSSGTADFHFLVNSNNHNPVIVPFSARSSDVANDDALLQPGLSLGANYPNPFRGSTTFSLSSEKSGGSATLQIFNLKGQKVSEVILPSVNQGANSVQWQVPESLPAGIYLYRLENEPGTLRRMLHLK